MGHAVTIASHLLQPARRFRRAVAGSLRRPPTPAMDEVRADELSEPRSMDLVTVTDLRFPGGSSSSLCDELIAAAAGGYRMGVLHLANPRLGSQAAAHPGLRRLIDDGTAVLLLPGEPVRARLVVIKHPSVFTDSLGGRLSIEADLVIITVGQVPEDRNGVYYDAVAVHEHISEAFGVAPVWMPPSPMVRAVLRDVPLSDDDWVEVIDERDWQRAADVSSSAAQDTTAAQTATGGADDRLVIGRHSRPGPLKWPSDPDQLRAAYPTDGSVRVRVLGGADAAVDVLGELPADWEVLPFGSMAPVEFLAGLDALVYFPHPDATEAFGRTILEGLAARVPTVVPDYFQPLFGDACLYATPDTAVDATRALLADGAASRAHVERAASLVAERFSHAAHRGRLDRLIGPPAVEATAWVTPTVPSLDLAPPGQLRASVVTLVACLGSELADVELVLRALDQHRRHAPGFVPIVVVTITRPHLADQLGVEVRVITARSHWTDEHESWPDYAQRRLRQISGHFSVDSLSVADPTHPDAWIALQLLPPTIRTTAVARGPR